MGDELKEVIPMDEAITFAISDKEEMFNQRSRKICKRERRKFMKKYILIILSLCFFVLLKKDASAASNTENSNSDFYQPIYEKCMESSYESVYDDYSAYSYLLKHIENVYVLNGHLYVENEIYAELTESEIQVVNDFVLRVNNLIDLSAIVIESDLKISQKEAPIVGTQVIPRIAEYNLMSLARSHATELRGVYDNALFGTAHLTAGEYFMQRVKSGGAWDLKQYLGLRTYYRIPDLNVTMTGETIGNFHYGYVGSSCFGPTLLKTAAGVAQIWAGTSSLSFWNSYFDDPADQEDIQWGIDVYNREH